MTLWLTTIQNIKTFTKKLLLPFLPFGWPVSNAWWDILHQIPSTQQLSIGGDLTPTIFTVWRQQWASESSAQQIKTSILTRWSLTQSMNWRDLVPDWPPLHKPTMRHVTWASRQTRLTPAFGVSRFKEGFNDCFGHFLGVITHDFSTSSEKLDQVMGKPFDWRGHNGF